MESAFKPSLVESDLYKAWEKNKLFLADPHSSKKPFSIILPPPNANADLHLGHAMYVFEDIMIRYQKIQGFETLWLPGADHAGFETQYVFEKYLQKSGKSRFDYDRETLFTMIWDFVMNNKGVMDDQMKRLGFALDWTKKKFTLDQDIVKIVNQTFEDLFNKGLVYRDVRLVNYCTFCGTAFSDLEVVYKEKTSPLYYIQYGPFVLATTRPETKFGDTGIAVNPKDKRYAKWIGKEIKAEGLLGTFTIKVVGDESVDPKFGTGVVKVTPAHDFTDFETGARHGLPMKQVVGFDGKLNEHTGPYKGLYVGEARKRVVEDMQTKGLLVKIDETYQNRVGTCYKCSRTIEPLPREQWFVKVRPLADNAKKLIEEGQIKIYPKRFKKILLWWLTNFKDWNISRQIVWGIRIPAYKCVKLKVPSTSGTSDVPPLRVNQSSKGGWFVSAEKPTKCRICGECKFEQDTDTFDTWFSSSQWPFATLQTQGKDFFQYFYPTSVMETGYDILPWWVARMIMMGFFSTKTEPFKTVFLHGMVRDRNNQKMSKSKGNVINPLVMIDKYGADALRAALVFGVKEGSDLVLTEEKIIGMRNFTNKLWNIGRFIEMNRNQKSNIKNQNDKQIKIIKELQKEFKGIQKKYTGHMKNYQFSKALDLTHQFVWHRFADYYIEQLKESMQNGNIKALGALKEVYLEILVLLHPYIPFVTDAIWQVFQGENTFIMQRKLEVHI